MAITIISLTCAGHGHHHHLSNLCRAWPSPSGHLEESELDAQRRTWDFTPGQDALVWARGGAWGQLRGTHTSSRCFGPGPPSFCETAVCRAGVSGILSGPLLPKQVLAATASVSSRSACPGIFVLFYFTRSIAMIRSNHGAPSVPNLYGPWGHRSGVSGLP